MIDQHQPSRVVILRLLIGGTLVLLSLPLLAPLIVGVVITRAIQGACVVTQRLRSEGAEITDRRADSAAVPLVQSV